MVKENSSQETSLISEKKLLILQFVKKMRSKLKLSPMQEFHWNPISWKLSSREKNMFGMEEWLQLSLLEILKKEKMKFQATLI